MDKVFVYDPTLKDKQSSVRGIGRYLQILKENFKDEFEFVNNETMKQLNNDSVFINPFFNFLQPPLTLRRIARKQIAVIHDLIPLKYPSHFPAGIKGSIYILLNKLTLRNYNLIITDSEASKRDIINILKIKSEKLRVVYPCLPNSFSKLKIESRLGREKIENYVMYVGDATWNKNLVNLARAIKIANVTCVFVGNIFNPLTCKQVNSSTNKWLTEFKQFLKEVQNDKRFIFVGFVPDSELIKLYQQASLNILPSRDEGFGFSYLEAAQFSCPSVLSDIPVLKEISDGNSSFADPENPQDLADKIGEIYFNNDLRNEIGTKAKKRAGYFSSKKFVRDFLTAIK